MFHFHVRERGTSFSDLVVNILKGHQMLTILGEEQYKDYKGMVILRSFSRIFFMQCLGTGDTITTPVGSRESQYSEDVYKTPSWLVTHLF